MFTFIILQLAQIGSNRTLCQRWVMFGSWQYVINCWRADIGPTLKPQQLKCCTLLAKRWSYSTTSHQRKILSGGGNDGPTHAYIPPTKKRSF